MNSGEIKDGFYVGDDGIYEIIRRGDGWNTAKKIMPKDIFVEAIARYLNITIGTETGIADNGKTPNWHIVPVGSSRVSDYEPGYTFQVDKVTSPYTIKTTTPNQDF